MGREATKAIGNPWYEARMEAAKWDDRLLSREGAAELLGMSVSAVADIERDQDLDKWQGTQICAIEFDELTHFSEKAFFYMLSRNRSTCGVKPFVRASCNPDADSWVAKFIEWWIDQDTGYPIPERSGKIRYFVRREEKLYWADTRKELWERFNLNTAEEREEPKSVTFIMSRLEDNKELLRVNPGYMANLKAMPLVERERLLYGNYTYILRRGGVSLYVGRCGEHASPKGEFSVRGHYRHYKSGKIVWINEYRKGEGKRNGKKYCLSKKDAESLQR